MKSLTFLFFFAVLLFSISSGCINDDLQEESPQPLISSVDVMTLSSDEDFELKVTVYVQNPQEADTGSLSLKVKTRNPETNLIGAENVAEIGYLKAGTHTYKSMTFTVPKGGEQVIEAELFENDILTDSYSTPVQLVAEKKDEEPSIMLTDLVIETKQVTNYGKDIIVDVSPGILNQGEELSKLTLVITAISDPYTRYTGSTIISNVEANRRTRGSLRMTVPADDEYQFEIAVQSEGDVLTSARSSDFIKLHDLKTDTPVTYLLIEEGAPVEEPVDETAEEEPAPGFTLIIAGLAAILAFGIFKRKKTS